MPPLVSRLLAVLLVLAGAPFVRGQSASPKSSPEVACVPVRPSATDPAIKEFDEPSWVYVKKEIVTAHDPALPADRHQLLLWIPGTRRADAPRPEPGHLARGASHAFCELAASLGYHVIAVSYPNSLPASSCRDDPEPTAFETFRTALIAGGTNPHITVSRTDSIEHRLTKLLGWLAEHAPKEGWDTFLGKDGSIQWESVAVAGQSQGGGHAALVGINHRCARVICFGAPKDYSSALQAPAAWYAKPSATPKDRFFAFNHEQDRQGCSPEHQLDNLRALGLGKFGAPVRVEENAPPYGNSHILTTNFPGGRMASEAAHATPISPENSRVFEPVWRYLLTK